MTDHPTLDPPDERAQIVERELETMRRLIAPVAERLSAAGHQLFLVGGVVRDLRLLGAGVINEPDLLHDIDLTTDARPPAIKAALEPSADALWNQGERFGTIAAHVGGRSVEITTHRAEAYDPESRKPVVTFGDDLHTDLSRRDFTINAMAIEVVGGRLHDPFGGSLDLDNRILRTPLDPEVSFDDDPLRMLRAARFIPRFDLTVDPPLVEAATRMADRLDIVSRERVQDELERLLAVDDPRRGLGFLAVTGLLDHVVPGAAAAGAVGEVIERVCRASGATARRAALGWSLGDDGMARWLRSLRYSSSDRDRTIRYTRGAVAILERRDPSRLAGELRRAAKSVGADSVREVITLAAAVTGESLDAVHAAFAELEAAEDLDDLSIPLDGVEIMELLDLAPGPLVGQATDQLVNARLDGGPLTADRARALLRSWWSEHGSSSARPVDEGEGPLP